MSDRTTSQQFLPPGEYRHEASDVSARHLTLFLAALVASLTITGLLLAGLLRVFARRADRSDPAPSPLAGQRAAPPQPRLQVSERDDLHQFRSAEDEILHRKQWLNRQEGIAEIGIEQALQIVADQGLPDWPNVPVKGELEE